MEELWDKTKIILVRLAHFNKRGRIRRYGVPFLLTLFIFSLKEYLHGFFGEHSAFLLASFTVAASSWYGGLGPGILATFLSLIAIYTGYLITNASSHPVTGDLVLSGIFLLEGLVISIVSEARYEMERQKDEFIGFISHELKNPLTAVKGFSGLIATNAKKRNCDKLKYYGEQITYQADGILELIDELLDVTRIEIGRFTYNDSFFNLSELIRETIKHQQIIAKERVIKFYGKSKKLVYGDRYRIGQVMTNLLTNALKYSPENKKVIVKVKENTMATQVSIKDFGIGISKENQKHVFKTFYRTEDVEKKRSEGLGLGLYVTKQIVTRHKGNVWVQSQKGKGSTFFFSLPLQK